MSDEHPKLTCAKLASEVGVNLNTVYRWIRVGLVPPPNVESAFGATGRPAATWPEEISALVKARASELTLSPIPWAEWLRRYQAANATTDAD